MRNINKFFLILTLLFFKTITYGSENFYDQAVDKFNSPIRNHFNVFV